MTPVAGIEAMAAGIERAGDAVIQNVRVAGIRVLAELK